MLVTTKTMLKKAKKGKYAVGGFNTNNLEFTQAIASAAKELNSPVIIQTTENAIKYAGVDYLSSIVRTAEKNVNIPVALHLDHGKNLDIIKKCLKYDYTSIMIDASGKSFDKNVKLTKKIVKKCKPEKVPVEAELGPLVKNKYTKPEQAKQFVDKTGIDSLAIAIGNQHGLYKDKPDIHFDILEEINKKLSIPLVLHGSSDLPKKTLKKCIKLGICKINTDTDLRISFMKGFTGKLNKERPRKYLSKARENVKKKVKQKIKIYGSKDKAWSNKNQ